MGDLVDRGPNSPDVLRIAMSMTAAGTAYAVQGNHDRKFERWLAGRKVTIAHACSRASISWRVMTEVFARPYQNFSTDFAATFGWMEDGLLWRTPA